NDEDEIGLREGDVVARRPEDELDRDALEPREPLGELLLGLGIGDRHGRTLTDEETREARGRAAFAQADDRDAAPAELVRPELGVKENGHDGRPRKAICVPYRPSASRAR